MLPIFVFIYLPPMCFTVAIDLVREELEKEFLVSVPAGVSFEPAYYFSAFDHPRLPLITSGDPEKIILSRWGLVPSWVRDRTAAEKIRNATINARTETVLQKPSFRHLAGRKHCLLPVSGFYEWHDHHGRKIPYFLRWKDHKAFGLAGLYDLWTDRETGEMVHSFTLLTVPASPLVARIHNTRKRMPLLLPPGEGVKWVKKRTFEESLKEIHPLPEKELDFYPLAPGLTGRAADPHDPALIQRWEPGFDPLGDTLF